MIAALLSFALANWRSIGIAVFAATLAAWPAYRAGHAFGYHAGWTAGREALAAETDAALKEKTNAAEIANETARRCNADPACRVLDDGWRINPAH